MTLPLAGVGILAATLATGGNLATAGEVASPATSEMSASAATEAVVTRFGREDGGVLGALSVTTVHTTMARAQAVIEGQPVSEAESGGAPSVAAWRESPVYMVVMKAPAGVVFTPNVPVPHGHTGPVGNVMSVVIDATTGFKEGLSLESTVPSGLAELGSLTPTAEPAVNAAQAASLSRGTLAGGVYLNGKARSGWRVLVGKARFVGDPIARRMSGQQGMFAFRLAPGEYQVGAWNPHGGLCGRRTVHVTSHKTTSVKLTCSSK